MNILTIGDGKNHNYGKLVDGVLELSPASLIVGNKQYIGNDSTRYANAGYLPIIYADKPEDTDTGHYEPVYTETDGQIVQAWEFVSDIPEGFLDTSIITDWSRYCFYGSRHETVDYIDTSNGTKFTSMFENYTTSGSIVTGTGARTHIPVEKLNTSNGEYFDSFCSNNKDLTEIASFDTSKAESLSYCFENCPKLQNAPILNTPVCALFNHMYYKCSALVNGGTYDMRSVPKASGILYVQYMFAACSSMTNVSIKTDSLRSSNMVRMFYQCSALTDLTIEGTIKVDDNNLNVAYSPKLTVESLLSVLNALEDNTGESTQYTVYLGSSNLVKLTQEQRNIATNKNIKLG